MCVCFFFGCPPEEKRRRRFCRRGCYCLAVLKVAVCRGGVFGIAVRRRARAGEEPAACRYTRARLSYHDDDNDVLVCVDAHHRPHPPPLSSPPSLPSSRHFSACSCLVHGRPCLDTFRTATTRYPLSRPSYRGCVSRAFRPRRGTSEPGGPACGDSPSCRCVPFSGEGARSLVFQADGRRLTVLRFSSCCLRAVAY